MCFAHRGSQRSQPKHVSHPDPKKKYKCHCMYDSFAGQRVQPAPVLRDTVYRRGKYLDLIRGPMCCVRVKYIDLVSLANFEAANVEWKMFPIGFLCSQYVDLNHGPLCVVWIKYIDLASPLTTNYCISRLRINHRVCHSWTTSCRASAPFPKHCNAASSGCV